tara:strand:+ start:4744 stop:4884 length:141 start_codon:yes stop_codon:yes gene_type:complete
MASTSKGKGAVKTVCWNKHYNRFYTKQQNKLVRRDGKKQIKEEQEK